MDDDEGVGWEYVCEEAMQTNKELALLLQESFRIMRGLENEMGAETRARYVGLCNDVSEVMNRNQQHLSELAEEASDD